MKKIVLFVLFVSICCTKLFCQQHNDPCAHTTFMMVPHVGVGKNGVILGTEAGIWSLDKVFGFYAGFDMYNVNKSYPTPELKAQYGDSYKDILFDPYGRLSVKFYSDYEKQIFQALTVQTSLHGLIGVSWRGYKQIGYNGAVGVEAGFDNKNGPNLKAFVIVLFN